MDKNKLSISSLTQQSAQTFVYIWIKESLMKQIPLILLLVWSLTLDSQTSYFQQEVNHEIKVRLDDELHILNGQSKITYKNHSPDTLFELYFHLWPNAYRDQTTAFAQQLLRQGQLDFYFSKDSQLGHISNLAFSLDGQTARWRFDKQHRDIAIIRLEKPLLPGATTVIETPFRVKLPDSFSRLGHVAQSYQITQWYPKPAVYDRDGWHPMPYLDDGEFYSEFGSYDVSITLPANYLVGATGTLQNKDEKAWLAQKSKATQAYLDSTEYLSPFIEYEDSPLSSEQFKTLHFTAEKVHDFAWFADKRFKVLLDQVELPNSEKVEIQAFFTESEEVYWQNALKYLKQSLVFYSEKVGNYPYPQMTVVQSALSAGGGMEYPMITVIDEVGDADFLDEVIAHEVGHNWFYGILASNERTHAWMDEGINSYYEERYTLDQKSTEKTKRLLVEEIPLAHLGYLYKARIRKDQAPNTSAEKLTTNNYVLAAYRKPTLAFKMLEKYLGTARFDKIMQGFYQKWKFKHPSPIDLQFHLEQASKENLDWLFSDILGSTKHYDYAIQKVKRVGKTLHIKIKNKGEFVGPVAIGAIKNKEVQKIIWHPGAKDTLSIQLPDEGYHKIAIDPLFWTPDLRPKNNYWDCMGPFPKLEPVNLPLLGTYESATKSNFHWGPMYAWNAYDQSMFGLAFYNTVFPHRRFEYYAAPLFGLGSESLTGAALFQYHLYPKASAIERISIGLQGKSFNFFSQEEFNYELRFSRWTPFLRLQFRTDPISQFSHSLEWRSVSLWIEEAGFSDRGRFLGTTWENTYIHRLSYAGKNQRALHPFNYTIALEGQQYTDNTGPQQYVRASIEGQTQFTYAEGSHFFIRFFSGFNLINSRRNAGGIRRGAFNLASQGFNDYRFEDSYFGRNESTGFWSQQITVREGGFKTPIPKGFPLGRSNDYIAALNLKVDLPIFANSPVHIRPYFDVGYFHNATPLGENDTLEDQLMWNGGVAVELLDGVLGFYFPFASSKNLQNRLLERGSYFNRISFAFDINRGDPRERWGRF